MSWTHRAGPLPVDAAQAGLWWGIFFGWWTALMGLFALQIRVSTAYRGNPVPWGDAFVIGALDSYSWALLALAAIWLARRNPLERTRWPRLLAVHFGAALVLVPGRLVVFAGLAGVLGVPSRSGLGIAERLLIAVPTNLLVYLLMVGVGYALEFVRRFRERELAEARLETRLASARLEVRTRQLQPRFLFSALRSVSTQMHHDVAGADRTLALLGDLLRSTLHGGHRETATLREEIEFLELYLAIEQVRFGDGLRVEWRVELGLSDWPVPFLILQPLVENALHCSARPEWIGIRAESAGDRLVLEVRDACIRRRAAPVEEGLALGSHVDAGGVLATAHAEARLRALYGDAYRFDVGERDGGTVVRIEIPGGPAVPDRGSEEPEPSAHLLSAAT
jgi:two-component system, LytTR family, sensor kinase